MKNIILVILLFSFGYCASAQAIQLNEKPHNILIKVAPIKLAFQSFGIGAEYKTDKSYSFEIEGTVKNVIPQLPMNPMGYSADNNSLYFDVSARVKAFFPPLIKQTPKSNFQGLYVAPGISVGTEEKGRNHGDDLYLKASFDLGYMLAETDRFVMEIFTGYETRPAAALWILVYTSRPRLGVRMGVTI